MAGVVGFKECFACGEILDCPSVRLEQAANPFAHVTIVIDHENHRRFGRLEGVGLARQRRMRHGSRDRKQALDCLHDVCSLDRLVELHTVLAGDAPQGIRRDVAGQNDDRYPVTQCFSYLRGDEQPVHPIWQVVVSENEVRLKAAMDHQFQRLGTVGRCCRDDGPPL